NLTEMMGKDCFVDSEDQGIRFFIGSDGLYPKLWGHALNSLEPFFTNDPSNHSMSKGVPKGHVKLKNFLTAPAVHLGKLVGQISIANSARNYTSRDLEVVARLTDLFAIALGRKLSEKALRESEQQFKHVLQNSINTIYSFNLTTGTYDYLSPSVKTIYGYTPEEMISRGLKTTIENFHPDDRAKIDNHLQRLLDKKLEDFSPT
ncbi:MAG: GAF domain-containing protein, partial [Desulfobacteraceae bacterium]|nr:GAF domain-containing protein [Desulfobacteraceae bacterium]